MEWLPQTDVKVLIVENEVPELEGNKRDLESIKPKELEKFGIVSFDIHLARALDEAEQSLSQANGAPFDLMLLDLGIPITINQPRTDKPENGERVMNTALKLHAAKGIVVISVFDEVDRVARAFKSGVIDYIEKPFLTVELQIRVIESWKRLLKKESDHLLGEKRIRDLVPNAERALAHRFNICLSDFERTVVHTSEALEREVRDRFGLDRTANPQDVFFTRLSDQEESITDLKRKWAALNAPLQQSDSSDRTAAVDTLLKEIHRSLLPSLIVKNVILDFVDQGASEIVTFENDVKAVLREILAGAANAKQDFNEENKPIEIKVTNADGQVKVTFEDRLEPIRAAKEINEGSIVDPLPEFDRAWGLSVVQHIAKRGAGRLEILPRPRGGNIINYYIPSAT